MKLYDKNAVARFLDLTPKRIQQLTEKNIIKEKQKGLYSLIEANHDYINYLRDKNPETEEAIDYNAERAKLVKAKRINEEMELEVKKGNLHQSEDIEKVMSAMLINFKSRLSAIPAEEADKLASMQDKAKIFIYLNDRIKEALAELSDFESVFKEELTEDEEGNG